jgi:hypothetical protein
MIPDRRRDDASGTNHPAHLGDGPPGVRHEVEDQQGEGSIETIVGKRDRARVRLLDRDPRIRIPTLGFLDDGRRIVEGGDLAHVRGLRQREGQAAGPAPHVQNPLAVVEAGEFDERNGELPAPSAHQAFVPAGAANREARRHERDRRARMAERSAAPGAIMRRLSSARARRARMSSSRRGRGARE